MGLGTKCKPNIGQGHGFDAHRCGLFALNSLNCVILSKVCYSCVFFCVVLLLILLLFFGTCLRHPYCNHCQIIMSECGIDKTEGRHTFRCLGYATLFDCDTPCGFHHMSPVMRKPFLFSYAKTKTQISFAVTAKLISGFVFTTRIVLSNYFLNPEFQASSHLL